MCATAVSTIPYRVRWKDLVRRYPDLDRELDMIWQRYGR